MRYKFEIWDEVQKGFEAFNDHNLHAVVRFTDTVDFACLSAAVRKTIELVPVLGSWLVPRFFRSRWESAEDLPPGDAVELVETDLAEGDFDSLLERTVTQGLDETRGPQIAVRLLRNRGADTLCVVCSHMVCDGAGFKSCLYLIAELYGDIRAGKGTERDRAFLKRRTDRQVYGNLTPRDWLSFLTRSAVREKTDGTLRIGFERGGSLSAHMLVRVLDGESFGTLASRAKSMGYTVNDVLLAAYFRTIRQELHPSSSKRIVLPLMVDLRRYLRDRETAGICNLSSTLHCGIGPDIGEGFFDTVLKVHERMEEAKDGYPGLKSFFLLSSVLRPLPSGFRRAAIRGRFGFALLGMTNIGIIDEVRLSFPGSTIGYAYVNGSIKRPPYFQIAVSTWKGRPAFTVNQYCTEGDLPKIGRFLDAYVEQLAMSVMKLRYGAEVAAEGARS
jgi:NRPS condensation-like uncharacterized protein